MQDEIKNDLLEGTIFRDLNIFFSTDDGLMFAHCNLYKEIFYANSL